MSLYKNHRKALILALPKDVIVLTSAPEKQRNSDVDYFFRQDSDFLYLTGISQSNHTLVLDAKRKTSHLFIPDIDPLYRIWLGHQITAQEAKRKYGVDVVHYNSEFSKVFRTITKGAKSISTVSHGENFLKRHALKSSGKVAATQLRIELDELRVRKTESELELMRKANHVSKMGHVAAMQCIKPNWREYQAQAVLEREFLFGGAAHRAYPSIVASGRNAAVLHYHDNNDLCRDGDLLLIDAGCEIEGYASDITRTFPVSGKFSAEQAEIYDAVLKCQLECIAAVKPGITMADLHIKASHSLIESLKSIGILKNHPTQELFEKQAHALFFPHGLGHLLGLDVHDVGAKDPKVKVDPNKPKYLRTNRKLEPGFVVTVEPGLYFIAAHFESKEKRKTFQNYVDWKVAEKFFNVGGIRIEDDIAVTKTGYENLTSVPKTRGDIEAAMRN